jgi:hypothetical protein
MDFLPKLRAVADRWVAAWNLTDPSISLRTLGSRVVDNSKLFDRDGMNVDTFERVAGYLAQPRSWPLAVIPDDAAETLASIRVEAAQAA